MASARVKRWSGRGISAAPGSPSGPDCTSGPGGSVNQAFGLHHAGMVGADRNGSTSSRHAFDSRKQFRVKWRQFARTASLQGSGDNSMMGAPQSRRPHGVTALACLALCFLSFTPGRASQVRPLNLEEMTERADRIFIGRCVQVTARMDPELGQMVTYATFAAERSGKGGVHGQVTIKLLGDQRAAREPGRSMAGVPGFERGEEVVLFLYGESRRGLTSPVGLGHGKFMVVRDKNGQKLALNATGNESLFLNLSPGARRKLGTSSIQPARGGIDPDALLDMVQRLSGQP